MLKSTTRMLVAISILLSSVLLTSCTSLNFTENHNPKNHPFSGNWQGEGIDSEGNEYTFFATVMDLGDYKYRVLILDALDTQKKPMHIMDGELKNNKFPHTADNGIYVGGGELTEELFDGFYEGPVDGKYRMWKVK